MSPEQRPPNRRLWLRVAIGVAVVHFLATLVFALLAIAYDAHGNWPDRPWNQRAAISVFHALCFPIPQLSALMSEHGSGTGAELFLFPLNSALVGAVAAGAFQVVRRSLRRSALALACVFVVGTRIGAAPMSIEDRRESTVGIPARITDLVLPGSELEVLPQDAKTAVVLRIVRVAPHGSDMRYDFEWTGMDVGRHDLRAFLRRKDGTDVANLPEIAVDVGSVLAPGMVKPNHPPAGDVPRFGGYRAWMIGLGIAWVAGLAVILLGFRKRRAAESAAAPRPRTLAERLRPLVESAMAGTLGSVERAQLELGLVAYWRRRLGLDAERPDVAIAALRAHPEAGPLLAQLDAWLHKPGPRDSVDVDALLAPYKDLAPDALESGAMRS